MEEERNELRELKERVSALETQVKALERQVNAWNAAACNTESEAPAAESVLPESAEEYYEAVEKPGFCLDPIEQQTAEPVVAEEEPVAEPLVQEEPVVRRRFDSSPKPKPETSVEARIGKVVMPVAASVLIFVSLVLLGSLIESHLTPMVKAVIMAVISLVLAVTGLMKMNKESRFHAWFSAMAGCGVGACYVSALVSYFVLEVLTDVQLMCCILIWIAVVIVLSRVKSRLFTYICFVGIVIATVLTLMNWEDSTLGILMYVLGNVALFSASYRGDYRSLLWMCLQFPLGCFVILSMNDGDLIGIGIVAAATFTALLWQLWCFGHNDEENRCLRLVLLLTYVLSLSCYYWAAQQMGDHNWVPACVVAAAYLLLGGWMYSTRRSGAKLLLLVLSLTLPWLYYGSFYSHWLVNLLPAVILLAVGAWKKSGRARVLGYAYLLLWVLQNSISFTNWWPRWAVMVILVVILAAMAWWVCRHYSMEEKVGLSLLWLVALMYPHTCGWLCITMTYMLYGLASLVFAQKWYQTDLQTGEDEPMMRKAAVIYNDVMLAFGLMLIRYNTDPLVIGRMLVGTGQVALVITILMAIMLTVLNLKRLYSLPVAEVAMSIYNALRITVLLYFILVRLQTVSYLISIVGIVLAIAFIVVGFRFRLRGMRLYGLMLTLVSALKLLFNDIEVNNDWYRPVSILVAGLLLLGVSWIYYKMERGGPSGRDAEE